MKWKGYCLGIEVFLRVLADIVDNLWITLAKGGIIKFND